MIENSLTTGSQRSMNLSQDNITMPSEGLIILLVADFCIFSIACTQCLMPHRMMKLLDKYTLFDHQSTEQF